MKDFDANKFKLYEDMVLKHGSAYEEHKRGDIFVVFCPECGSPDVFVTNECDVTDKEVDETSFFWADYECKMCQCQFRSRFSRKKPRISENGWLSLALFFITMALVGAAVLLVVLGSDDFPDNREIWAIGSLLFAVLNAYLSKKCIDRFWKW